MSHATSPASERSRTISPLSPEVMHAAQILTGATMAGWLVAGFVPRHAYRIRVLLLALYLAGAAAFVVYAVSG